MTEEQVDKKTAWIRAQKRTFSRWFTSQLKRKGYKAVTDVVEDLDTGIKIMELCNALYDTPIPKHSKNPKIRAQKLDNLVQAFKCLESSGISTINYSLVGPHNLCNKDENLILGVVWGIILDYQIKGISVDELTAKEGLLLWCQQVTKDYDNVDVKNFSTSFKDGLAFNAIIHHFAPNLIDYSNMSCDDVENNINNALTVAEDNFDIPRLLEPEDLMVDVPDEKAVMTYISEYYHKFSELEQNQAYTNRVRRFLELARSVEELREFYNNHSVPFVNWCAEKIEELNAPTGDTTEEIRAALSKLLEWRSKEKAAKVATKYELLGKYHTLDALIQTNQFKSYTAPDGADTETIEKLWDQVDAADKARSASLGEKFKENVRAIFKKFDKSKDGFLNIVEFKAVLTSLGCKLSDSEVALVFERVDVDGDGNKLISLQEFEDYMVNEYVTLDTKDDIIRAFKQVAKNKDIVLASDLQGIDPPLDQDLIAWATSTMPSSGEGNDYSTYVSAQFD